MLSRDANLHITLCQLDKLALSILKDSSKSEQTRLDQTDEIDNVKLALIELFKKEKRNCKRSKHSHI